MTSSPQSLHRMNLRSRCDGSCGSASSDGSRDSSYSGRRHTPLQSPDTSPQSHHHHFHHHHHNHYHRSHHTGQSYGILDEIRAEETPVVQGSPLVPVRLTRGKAAELKAFSNQRALRTTVTRSIYTERTTVRSSKKATASHSDYSSADEELAVELNRSRTSSAARQLNGGASAISTRLNTRQAMSDSSDDEISLAGNQRNKRFASGLSSADGSQSARTSAFDERWTRTSTARSTNFGNGATPFRTQWPSPVEGRTSLVHLYGLDDDLDEEPIDVLKLDASWQHRQQSRIRQNMFSRLESAWWVFWRFVYWVIGSAMLLDTLFVIRCREFIYGDHRKARKYFVPLLLLLLLLGGSTLWAVDQNGADSSVVQSIANVPYFSPSYLYSFLNFSSTASKKTETLVETEAHADWAWLRGTNFSSVLRQMVLQIYGHPDEGRRPPLELARLDAMVQDAVRKRMTELGYAAPSAGDGGAGVAILEAEFTKLKAQVEASERNSGKYQSDYQAIRSQMNQYHQSVNSRTHESDQRIMKLEQMLLELQEKLMIQDHRHTLLLANMRNCCRNHSEYTAFVKDHVVMALNSLPDAPGAETCERLTPFQKWLKSYFTTKEDLHQHVSFMTEKAKGSPEADDERVARLLQANRAMIATMVEEQLKVQAAAAPAKATINLDGSVTEDQFKALIRQQIALYNADRLGLPDFALESSGGSVVSTRCSESYHIKTAQYSILGIGLWYVSNSPRTVIQPGVNPGECWAFKGAQGYLVIRLSRRIKISAFSLEHIPRSISPSGSVDTAPKEFQVLGLEDETTPGVELGNFVYDQDGEPLQYFVVKEPAEPPVFQVVELRILSNQGNLDYTCLYRFRVHGDLVQS